MSGMALLVAPCCLFHVLLLILVLNPIPSASSTVIHFFQDAKCSSLLFTVQTDTDRRRGTCQSVSSSGSNSTDIGKSDADAPSIKIGIIINSVYPTAVDPGCNVNVYLDLEGSYCTDGIVAPLGQCTASASSSPSLESYTVDCPSINGTNAGIYTTSYFSPSSWPSSAATSPAIASSSIPIKALSLTSTDSLPSSSALAASSSSHPPSPTSEQSDGNGGLSYHGKISIGAGMGIIGFLAVVVLVRFWFILQQRIKKKEEEEESRNGPEAAAGPSGQGPNIGSDYKLEKRLVAGGNSQQDVFLYANETFNSLPEEAQGKLYE